MRAYIKFIYGLNTFALITTLILYLTVYLGMYAQFLLGIIQLLIGFSLLFRWNEIEIYEKKLIKFYWLIVVSWFVLTFVFAYFNFPIDKRRILVSIWLFVIPMSIASYQFFITYRLNKQLKSK